MAAVGTGITLLGLAGLKPLDATVACRCRPTADTRLGLELDAAVLAVRDTVSSVQGVGSRSAGPMAP